MTLEFVWKNAGFIFLLFLFIFPLVLYLLSKHVGWKWLSSFRDFCDERYKIFIIFYFLATSTYASLIGNNFSLVEMQNDVFSYTLLHFNQAAILLLILIVPVAILTFMLDRFITEITHYERAKGTLFDPTTGEENISLRYSTFIKLVNSLENPSSVGSSIGESFGSIFLNKRTNDQGRIDLNQSNVDEFMNWWREADKHAAWFKGIKPVGTDFSTKLELEYLDSYARRGEAKQPTYKPCQFLQGYTAGLIKKVFNTVDGKQIDVELRVANCDKCSVVNKCIFDVTVV